MYKPTMQNTCSLRSAVNELCKYTRKKTPAMALVSLSETASYFSYPSTEDHVNYAIVPIDNGMTWVVGLTSRVPGRLSVLSHQEQSHERSTTSSLWVRCRCSGLQLGPSPHTGGQCALTTSLWAQTREMKASCTWYLWLLWTYFGWIQGIRSDGWPWGFVQSLLHDSCTRQT